MAGAVHLGDLQRQGVSVVWVACSRCDRKGRYRVTALIERFGAGCVLPDVGVGLSADCPKHQALLFERCSVYFSETTPKETN